MSTGQAALSLRALSDEQWIAGMVVLRRVLRVRMRRTEERRPSTFDTMTRPDVASQGPGIELIRLRCGHNNEVSNVVFICCGNIRAGSTGQDSRQDFDFGEKVGKQSQKSAARTCEKVEPVRRQDLARPSMPCCWHFIWFLCCFFCSGLRKTRLFFSYSYFLTCLFGVLFSRFFLCAVLAW